MNTTFANLMDNGQRIALYCPECRHSEYISPIIVAVREDLPLRDWKAAFNCPHCRSRHQRKSRLKIRPEGH